MWTSLLWHRGRAHPLRGSLLEGCKPPHLHDEALSRTRMNKRSLLSMSCYVNLSDNSSTRVGSCPGSSFTRFIPAPCIHRDLNDDLILASFTPSVSCPWPQGCMVPDSQCPKIKHDGRLIPAVYLCGQSKARAFTRPTPLWSQGRIPFTIAIKNVVLYSTVQRPTTFRVP
jgi:hypothetical protein